MARGPRIDYPGAWHHIYNRGTARRTIIENDRDGRMFLSFVAWQVHAGHIEVHAYALMTTHFHLLVRSPDGGLPRAMQRIQDGYSKWFNRGRRRDGPLFRGRYGNRLVESDSHWFAVVPYIHDNPVSAGLAERPEDFPFSSAGPYARRAGPPWLSREVVEREFTMRGTTGPSAPLSPGTRWLVGRWLHGRRHCLAGDPLDELAGQPPERVLRWMERKARLADGTRPGWVMAVPTTVRSVLAERVEAGAIIGATEGGDTPPRWPEIEAGILRAFCGLSHEEISLHTSTPVWRVKEGIRRYARVFRASPVFRGAMARLLHECLARDHSPSRRRWRERMGAGWASAAPAVSGRR